MSASVPRAFSPIRTYHLLMGPKGFAPWLGRAAGGSGSRTAGPAVTTLRVAGTRTTSIIRCASVACTAAQVVIWHAFYLASPWRLVGPAVAMTWGIAAVVYLLRRWPVWPLAVADSGVYIVLALCARWFLPPLLRGDSSNWLYITMAGQMVSPAWFTPPKILAVIAIAAGASYWAGSAGSHSAAPATAGVIVFAIALAAWLGRRMLYRRAVTADAALDRDDRASREQYVVFSRYTERREQERLLHDTVLNTLTALARPDSGRGDVASRCKEDVALIERMLGDTDEFVSGSLLTAIETVAGSMHSRGLRVRVDADPAVPEPPTRVVQAITYAVREALANVASHAGTDEAVVSVSSGSGGSGSGGSGGGLTVVVRDDGVGFDPAEVDPARLGLRRSVVERIADQGGKASVSSTPGGGTVVTLCWALTTPAVGPVVSAVGPVAGSRGGTELW